MTTGFLVIDKPPGITSHDVVAIVRSVTGISKVGHTGTLDPFATGVLPLALGAATRLVQFLDESIKVYDATVSFGTATDTGDPTGRVIARAAVPAISEARLDPVLQSFLGLRMQRPPAYSAVKHKGKPLYRYAREGKDVEAEPRPVQIHAMERLDFGPEWVRLRITCSRGTYARVLANEVAEALGTVGHLAALCRPRSGPFLLEDALDMDRLAEIVSAEPGRTWQEVLAPRRRDAPRVPWKPRDTVLAALAPRVCRPLAALSHLPLVDVRPGDAFRIRNGGNPPPAPTGASNGSRYLVVNGDDLVAISEHTVRGPRIVRVLPAA